MDVTKKKPDIVPRMAWTSPHFIIERNKNANVVHYDAQLTADGILVPRNR